MNYKILYDIKKDIWNWYYGAKYSDNARQLDGDDFAMARDVARLNKRAAEKILRPFLRVKLDNKNSSLNKFIKIAERDFAEKFVLACEALARITSKPFVDGDFTFFITTFPRMVVFFDEKIIFTYAKIDDKLWGKPIDGFLHEGLHFQFEYYWWRNPKSPVARLSEDEYFTLKEALTVVLDDELKPIITVPDNSYPEFAQLRGELHDFWKKHHDFDKLVEYGLKKLPEFTTSKS